MKALVLAVMVAAWAVVMLRMVGPTTREAAIGQLAPRLLHLHDHQRRWLGRGLRPATQLAMVPAVEHLLHAEEDRCFHRLTLCRPDAKDVHNSVDLAEMDPMPKNWFSIRLCRSSLGAIPT